MANASTRGTGSPPLSDDRDDDTTAKEYSPPPAILSAGAWHGESGGRLRAGFDHLAGMSLSHAAGCRFLDTNADAATRTTRVISVNQMAATMARRTPTSTLPTPASGLGGSGPYADRATLTLAVVLAVTGRPPAAAKLAMNSCARPRD